MLSAARCQGGRYPTAQAWNNTVLHGVGGLASSVDAHYYPFGFKGSTGGKNPTDQHVLQRLKKIPAIYQKMRRTLNRYAPKLGVIIGATNISSAPTTALCTPLGAVFAAGDVLSWLAAGAESVDWWYLSTTAIPSRAPRTLECSRTVTAVVDRYRGSSSA